MTSRPESPPARVEPEGPPRPAGRSELEVRRFFLVFLASSGLSLLAVAAINFAVNPMGLYAHRWLPPLALEDRAWKLELLSRLPRKPGVLILGSSRSMLLDPATVERSLGLPAFNLTVTRGLADDSYALLRAAVEDLGVSPRLVLVGLDLETFHDQARPEPGLVLNPLSSRHLLFGERRRAAWVGLTRALSLWYLSRSLLSLSLWAGLPDAFGAAPAAVFRADGLLDYKTWSKQKRLDDLALQRRIGAFLPDLQSQFGEPGRPFGRRAAYLEALARYARERGLRLAVFLLPIHDNGRRALERLGYGERRRQVRDHLAGLSRAYGFAFEDFNDPRSFGGDPDGFYDAYHSNPDNAEILLRRILLVLPAGS